ncbi:hypothetical protein CEE37_10425 [candidate division LCP-89 bacterium B3_LCP]|uniref:DUF5668 domain-containing protein n=1 Tax=candidate division LCP-89 bacterium B3_LCP TaxID=2012998 RepID=A0A532UY61_UNCL8|nr:MAG: hypothetical protein CEE37_10425 [candidate division LCP-89 bacterium B3_LCP]
MGDLEKKLEELSSKVEERFKELSDKIEGKLSSLNSSGPKFTAKVTKKHDTPFWGIVLVIAGFVLLGEYFDWFNLNVPFLPAALIVLGAWLIIDKRI